MPGLLTGDYEAVLQVSEATIDRLLASMHQNAGADPDTPTFPHSVGIRLGDVDMVDGIRGTAWGQVGVPRIHLIDGATDRFWLDVGVRLRYRPDPGTAPLPEFIHGTVRAQYALEDIDPSCHGWRQLAADYLWLRVVEDTVSFEGDVFDDVSPLTALTPQDPAALNAAVTRQIVALLDSTFAPTPHKVSKRFRRGSFVSLDQPIGVISASPLPVPDLPVGGAAVTLPVGITHDPPAGSLGSVHNVLLSGRDFAVAVGQDVVMAMIEPALDDIRGYSTSTSFTVTESFLGFEVNEDTFVYDTSISSVIAVWVPHGSYATIEVAINGGAHTNSVLPDFTFSVTQRFQMDFDAGAEQLRLWSAGNTCQMHASGLGLPGDMLHNLAVRVANEVEAMAETAAATAQPSLQKFGNGRSDLVTQLRTLDAAADAHFDDASFYLEGIVLRGWISVKGRHRPDVEFVKVDDDMFSALASWIPGGRIDELEWTWTWSGAAHSPGHQNDKGRYVLRRPRQSTSKFGLALGREPLPGLDGSGSVCLTIRGVRVDTSTGALVPVESSHKCTRFGFGDILQVAIGRVLLSDVPVLVDQGPHPPHPPEPPERGLVDASHHGAPGSGANTLVVLARRGLTEHDDATLREGLAACRRDNAGLLVVLLLEQGVTELASTGDLDRLRRLAREVEAPLLVSEDVDGTWASVLGAPDQAEEVSWRLVSPDGGVMWMHDGRIGGHDLAEILDAALIPSPPARPQRFEPVVDRGVLTPEQVGALFDHPHHERPHCPPMSLLRNPGEAIRTVVSTVTFATGATARSASEVRTIAPASTRQDGGGPIAVVVLDGASADVATTLNDELGAGYLAIADGDGRIAESFGVRRWPTTIPVGDTRPPVEPTVERTDT